MCSAVGSSVVAVVGAAAVYAALQAADRRERLGAVMLAYACLQGSRTVHNIVACGICSAGCCAARSSCIACCVTLSAFLLPGVGPSKGTCLQGGSYTAQQLNIFHQKNDVSSLL
jgi:hypothetical protein